MLVQTIVLVLMCSFGAIYAETYSSVAHMRALLESEKTLIQEIKDYIKMEEIRITNTKRAIEELEEKSRCCSDLSHPLNAFHSVRAWYQVTKRLNNAPSNHQYLESRINQTKLPMLGQEDYQGSIAALLRLQVTYKLNSTDLSRGNIYYGDKLHTAQPLDVDSVFEVGKKANDLHFYDQAVDWLTLSISMATKPTIHMVTELTDSYKHMGEMAKALETAKRAKHVGGPNKRKIEKLILSLQDLLQRQEEQQERRKKKGKKGPKEDTSMWALYNKMQKQILVTNRPLCRGDATAMNPYLWRQQRCTYQYYMVGGYLRFKLEIYSEDPWVVVYHDVLSDAESLEIRNFSSSKLKRATEQTFSGFKPTSWRIAKLTWLNDNDHDALPAISQRIAMVTGLNTNNSWMHLLGEPYRTSTEALQVVNYGIGGQYDPHYDSLSQNDEVVPWPPSGDRIATFMFYLNDVTAGGDTVFTDIGIGVKPVKNSALFWYNRRRGGARDLNTKHAGCPVLIGEKWVANKWILEHNNQFHRRCGLNMDDGEFPRNMDRNKMFIL